MGQGIPEFGAHEGDRAGIDASAVDLGLKRQCDVERLCGVAALDGANDRGEIAHGVVRKGGSHVRTWASVTGNPRCPESVRKDSQSVRIMAR